MLEVKNVSVYAKNRQLLFDVDLSIPDRGAVGLTGSSGAGKTTLIKAITGILGRQMKADGEIAADGILLNSLSARERRALCGSRIGFIPQNPMTAFDPYRKISSQMEETLCYHLGISKKECRELSVKVLSDVNIHDPERAYDSFPSQLSGGMLQRVTVAIILAMKPKYILADEPTSALDENNRKLLVSLLARLAEDSGVLMISHDIRSLEALCPTVYIMEEGRISAKGSLADLLKSPSTQWISSFATAYKNQKQGEILWTDYR